MVRVKICGMTDETDALLAARLGADAVGLNFFAGSPRCICPEVARRIIETLPPFVEPVGLFVNESLEAVMRQAGELGLRTIQWHGDTHPLPPTGMRFIAAFSIRDRDSLTAISAYVQSCGDAGRLPAAILADGHVSGKYGGTGRVPPWDLLADFQPGVPMILAGGLTPENVALAIRRVRPFAVDVAGGVESSPGRKDSEKIRQFILQARQVSNSDQLEK
jgi:phosphoribosylanthranilate isomerase